MWKVLRQLSVRAGVVLLVAVLLCDVGHVFNIEPPAAPHVSGVVSLRQKWTDEQAAWFHTASQGTMIMPVDWFLALEQPEVRVLTSPRLLHDRDYLQRFGFIYDEAPCVARAKLPIGLAIEDHFRDPHDSAAGEPVASVVGLTCAACHTGQLNYRGRGIRIEGAPGNVDFGLFQSAVGRSLTLTLYVPCRFDRFAERVLGTDHDAACRKKLKTCFREFVESKLHERMYADSQHLYDLKGGNGRTDALALIGNRTFQDLANPENLAVTSAPVNFPPLWDAPWFDWVQYNASIAPPMVRNIGEALGVGARVVTNSETGEPYDSTVNVKHLHEIEKSLAGPRPFEGLAAPAWPEDILGPLCKERVAAGREVYAAHCRRCHPLVSELRKSYADDANPYAWTPATGAPGSHEYLGSRLVWLRTINLRQIGTDPAQALNMHKRVVQTPEGALSEGEALMLVTQRVRKKKYEELKLTEDQAQEFDSYRPTEGPPSKVIADNLGYRPRPLDGVWATAPYLHNGSVPSLYELLLPVERRSKTFYAGGREFDTEKVGLQADKHHGVFLFDTSIPGNLNRGHEFRNLTLEELERFDDDHGTRDSHASASARWARVLCLTVEEYQMLSAGDRQEHVRNESAKVMRRGDARLHTPPGVLGAEFTETERWALVEYLKSL